MTACELTRRVISYFDWQFDTMLGRLQIRATNKSTKTYRSNSRQKSKYKNWGRQSVFSEIDRHREKLEEKGEEIGEFGGINRGVSLAYYFVSALRYVSVYDQNRSYFGTGAIAQLQL